MGGYRPDLPFACSGVVLALELQRDARFNIRNNSPDPLDIPNRAALKTAYLAHAHTASHRLSRGEGSDWACDALDALVKNDPDAAWPLIVEIVNDAADDPTLAYIAAGPLEELIVLHSSAVIDRIESTAATNGQLRRALSGVWLQGNVPSQVFERLAVLIKGELPL